MSNIKEFNNEKELFNFVNLNKISLACSFWFALNGIIYNSVLQYQESKEEG